MDNCRPVHVHPGAKPERADEAGAVVGGFREIQFRFQAGDRELARDGDGQQVGRGRDAIADGDVRVVGPGGCRGISVRHGTRRGWRAGRAVAEGPLVAQRLAERIGRPRP